MLKKYMWLCAVCLCLLVVLAGSNVWAHSFTQTELAYMPATKQLELFKAGVIAPIDVLVAPTVMTAKMLADMDIDDTAKQVINGKRMEGDSMLGMLSHIFSLLNTYPVVNVSVALSSTNVSFGVQVMGNTFDDLATFSVDTQLSKIMPSSTRAS